MTNIKHAPPVRLDPDHEKLFTLAKRIARGEKIDAGLLSSALCHAVACSYHSLAETFLAAGADATAFADRFVNNGDPEKNAFTAVQCAVFKNDVRMIRLFSQYGVNFYKPVRQLLINDNMIAIGNAMRAALEGEKTAVANALLDAGFDIMHPDLHAGRKLFDFTLVHAIEKGNEEIALRMIDSLQEASYLHDYNIQAEAAESGLSRVIEKTLQKAKELGQPFDTHEISWAAICAVTRGHLKAFDVLIEAGADPNLFCTIGGSVIKDIEMVETLFHKAVMSPHLNTAQREYVVRALLQRGADPQIKSREDTPRNAIEMAHPQFTHLLPLLAQATSLREAFLLASVQPAIDKIYTGGDKPLPLPKRRVEP